MIYLKFWKITLSVLLVYRLQLSGSSADGWKIHVLFLKKTIPSNFKFLLLIDVFHTFSLSRTSRSRDQRHEPKKEASIKVRIRGYSVKNSLDYLVSFFCITPIADENPSQVARVGVRFCRFVEISRGGGGSTQQPQRTEPCQCVSGQP